MRGELLPPRGGHFIMQHEGRQRSDISVSQGKIVTQLNRQRI